MEQKLFCRTDGDGMESSTTSNDTPTLSKTVINPILASTPTNPRTRKPDEKTFNYSRTALVYCPSRLSQSSNNSFTSPFATTEKKLKFVPYEPYKAAVKPIIPFHKKKIPTKVVAAKVVPKTSQCSISESVVDSETLKKMESEIQSLTHERDSAQYKLKIQSQINEELKKLLVASVGEDMEARVQFLTEDKAKLAHDVRLYVQKLACDFEEKENLSIEADIWRSKFLASSVLIEELARWKAVLCKRSDDLSKMSMVLLSEMEKARQSNFQAYCQLLAVKEALDPLSVSSPKSREKIISSTNLLELSSAINQVSGNLKSRILGKYNASDASEVSTSAFDNLPTLTEAQTLANQLLSDKLSSSCLMSDSTCSETTDKVTALANLFAERLGKPSAFACCGHCSGEIKTV